MINELQARLHSLYNKRMLLIEVGPQAVGFERYRLVATGHQLYTIPEAADRIAVLESALRDISVLDDSGIARLLARNVLGLQSSGEVNDGT